MNIYGCRMVSSSDDSEILLNVKLVLMQDVSRVTVAQINASDIISDSLTQHGLNNPILVLGGS